MDKMMKRVALYRHAGFFGAVLLCGLFFGSDVAANSCVTSECHAAYSAQASQHEPVAAGDCASCHKQVQPTHPLAGAQSFELVATGAKLCTSCHEPMGRKLNQHAPVKDGDCSACHDPHGTGQVPGLLKEGGEQKKLCFGCHDEAMLGEMTVHGPAASGACTQCHDPHEANQKSLLKKPLTELCTSCHAEMAEGMASAPYVHSAVKESACTACHNPHSAPAASLLPQDLESLCLECHGRIGKAAKSAKTKHAALYREEKCSACHATHFSQYPALLFAPQQEVCFSCHGKDDFSKSDALKNIAKEIKGKAFLHGPLQKGACSACHNPHGSENPRLLKGAYPAGFYQPYQKGAYDFCLGCHDKNLLSFAETSIYTQFRNGKQNLHYVHVSDKYKGRSCRACHEPHASDAEKLMSGEGAKFGDWRIPTRFVPTDTGGSCAPGCHQPYAYDREDPVSYK